MIKLWLERGAWASTHARRYFSGISPEEIRRVGVIRHAALGDMVLVRPFLSEIKRYFPNAEVVLSVVSNYMDGIPHDLVDSIHVMPGNHIKGLSVLSRIKAAKEIGSVDILFDLADTTRSRYICFFASAKVRIGMSYKPYLSRLLHDAAVWRSDFVFEADNMLHALMLIGAKPLDPMSFSWRAQREGPLSIGARILYFPFASTSQKMWPIENWIELIEHSCKFWPQHEHLVLSGSQAWEKATDVLEIRFQFRPSNLEFEEPCSLDQLTKIIQYSALLISNDTGVRNLAIALGTPTIGIFFNTVPYRYLPRGAQHLATFRGDGSVPSADEVIQLMSRNLSREPS